MRGIGGNAVGTSCQPGLWFTPFIFAVMPIAELCHCFADRRDLSGNIVQRHLAFRLRRFRARLPLVRSFVGVTRRTSSADLIAAGGNNRENQTIVSFCPASVVLGVIFLGRNARHHSSGVLGARRDCPKRGEHPDFRKILRSQFCALQLARHTCLGGAKCNADVSLFVVREANHAKRRVPVIRDVAHIPTLGNACRDLRS